jgi:hypothetical protein
MLRMGTIHPHSWNEFPAYCMFYFAVMGVVHLAIFIVGCLILAALAIKQRGTFRRRIGRFGLFMGLLLVVGSVASGVWSCTVWGRLYFSTDYVFDFCPFWPITQKVMDARFGDKQGQLFGVSLFQLQLVWLLFAAPTWTATIILYRLIYKRPSANKITGPNAGGPRQFPIRTPLAARVGQFFR